MSAPETLDTLDPESQFLLQMRLDSKKRFSSDCDDEFGWDIYKENVKPLKRGRNVDILNQALMSHSNPPLKHSLLLTRRKLIEAISEYQG
ncbi:hypothetical protein KSS87_000499, partial [Heliosperma pusillum]